MGGSECTWCGVAISRDDRFDVYEAAGSRHACFCRLEHVVPWAIRGAHWNAADSVPELPGRTKCSFCGGSLPDTRIDMLRHRGAAVVDDAFCSVAHLEAWAKAGGRYAKG